MAWRIRLATVFKLLSWEYISRECFMQLFVFIPLPNDNASLYKKCWRKCTAPKGTWTWWTSCTANSHPIGVHDYHWACAVHCGTQVSFFCVKKLFSHTAIMLSLFTLSFTRLPDVYASAWTYSCLLGLGTGVPHDLSMHASSDLMFSRFIIIYQQCIKLLSNKGLIVKETTNRAVFPRNPKILIAH